MSLNPEEMPPGMASSPGGIFVDSLLCLEMVEKLPVPLNEHEQTLRTHSKLSSERWRDCICTAKCTEGKTMVVCSTNLHIYSDDLLGREELEQKRLRRMYFKKNRDKSSSEKLIRMLKNFEEIKKNYADERRKELEDKQKKQESSSQTDATFTGVLPSEPQKNADDRVFRKPAEVQSTCRRSTRLQSKSTSDVESGRLPTRRTASRDTPDPRLRSRRNSRASSRSASEVEDGGDNSERKSKVKSSKRTTSATRPKEQKEVQSSDGDESGDDSRRSTSSTKEIGRLKK